MRQITSTLQEYADWGTPIQINQLIMYCPQFNKTVRQDPKTPYNPEKTNDGSFKKWLRACGFEVGPLFREQPWEILNRSYVMRRNRRTVAPASREVPRSYPRDGCHVLRQRVGWLSNVSEHR